MRRGGLREDVALEKGELQFGYCQVTVWRMGVHDRVFEKAIRPEGLKP